MSATDERLLLLTLKRAAFVLGQAEVPFALAGSFAAYARGGPLSDHDVDFLIREQDAMVALQVLEQAGFRVERPPEGWLVKAYDDDRLVDLIYRPVEQPVTDVTLADTDLLAVNAVRIPVLSATRLMIYALLTFHPHSSDFCRVLPTARALREQIDWRRVHLETAHSPYAYAFLVLLDRLGVIALAENAGGVPRLAREA